MSESVSRPLHVFLCHSSGDKPAVRELYRKLSAEGWIDAWLDEEKLLPGQDWDYEIEKALDASDAVIVTLSTGSVSKEGYVQKELRFALEIALEKPEGTIFILPVRLDECERPRRLRPIQGIDYFPPERRDSAYARLRRSLELRAAALGIATETDAPVSTKTTSGKTQTLARPVRIRFGAGGHAIYSFADIEFVQVPEGKFVMGSSEEDEEERPQHIVNIPYDYYMGRFPVTNAQYAAYVGAKGSAHPVEEWKEKADHPVVNVSWTDAMAYCHWLNELRRSELPPGFMLRLPTEAEWEKAARGTEGSIYPWGDTFDETKGNVDSGGKNDTTPVGAYSPQGDSPYGAADMLGNIWEWTHSLFARYPYQVDDGREDELISGRHVQRGGSFLGSDRLASAASRYRGSPAFLDFVGFRVAVAPPLT